MLFGRAVRGSVESCHRRRRLEKIIVLLSAAAAAAAAHALERRGRHGRRRRGRERRAQLRYPILETRVDRRRACCLVLVGRRGLIRKVRRCFLYEIKILFILRQGLHNSKPQIYI